MMTRNEERTNVGTTKLLKKVRIITPHFRPAKSSKWMFNVSAREEDDTKVQLVLTDAFGPPDQAGLLPSYSHFVVYTNVLVDINNENQILEVKGWQRKPITKETIVRKLVKLNPVLKDDARFLRDVVPNRNINSLWEVYEKATNSCDKYNVARIMHNHNKSDYFFKCWLLLRQKALENKTDDQLKAILESFSARPQLFYFLDLFPLPSMQLRDLKSLNVDQIKRGCKILRSKKKLDNMGSEDDQLKEYVKQQLLKFGHTRIPFKKGYEEQSEEELKQRYLIKKGLVQIVRPASESNNARTESTPSSSSSSSTTSTSTSTSTPHTNTPFMCLRDARDKCEELNDLLFEVLRNEEPQDNNWRREREEHSDLFRFDEALSSHPFFMVCHYGSNHLRLLHDLCQNSTKMGADEALVVTPDSFSLSAFYDYFPGCNYLTLKEWLESNHKDLDKMGFTKVFFLDCHRVSEDLLIESLIKALPMLINEKKKKSKNNKGEIERIQEEDEGQDWQEEEEAMRENENFLAIKTVVLFGDTTQSWQHPSTGPGHPFTDFYLSRGVLHKLCLRDESFYNAEFTGKQAIEYRKKIQEFARYRLNKASKPGGEKLLEEWVNGNRGVLFQSKTHQFQPVKNLVPLIGKLVNEHKDFGVFCEDYELSKKIHAEVFPKFHLGDAVHIDAKDHTVYHITGFFCSNINGATSYEERRGLSGEAKFKIMNDREVKNLEQYPVRATSDYYVYVSVRPAHACFQSNVLPANPLTDKKVRFSYNAQLSHAVVFNNKTLHHAPEIGCGIFVFDPNNTTFQTFHTFLSKVTHALYLVPTCNPTGEAISTPVNCLSAILKKNAFLRKTLLRHSLTQLDARLVSHRTSEREDASAQRPKKQQRIASSIDADAS